MNNNFIINDNDVKLELNKKNALLNNTTTNILPISNEQRYGTSIDTKTNKITNQLDRYTTRDKLINSNSQYRISRINIDSRYRDKNPINIINKYIQTLNQLVFIENSKILKIMLNTGHNLKENDIITITNIKPKQLIQKPSTLTLKKNSKYLYINHTNHQFVGTNNYIRLSNIINADINDYFLVNIPLLLINSEHQIILINNNNIIDPDNYLIDIGIYSEEDYTYTENNYLLEILTINQINIKYINASYPISNEVQQGYHIISESSTNYIKINLSISTTSINENNLIYNLQNNMLIGLVSNSINGYPDPDFYKIKLKSYYNIKKIKLVSTEIPNSEMLIKTGINDSLYWQIVKDGSHIYKISISPGNYDANSLTEELKKQISIVKRKFGSYLNSTLYNEYCIPIININPSNNLFSMQINTIITLSSNISIYNSISDDNFIRLNISHPYHNLQAGYKITISNAINVKHTDNILYIPSDIINKTHIIESIIDIGHYIIKLDKYNPTSIKDNLNEEITNGGNAVHMQYNLDFRLLFNYPDTIGSVLGFTNLNNNISITIYNKEITNITPYINTSNINSIGLTNTNTPILNFTTYPYILMVSGLFSANINYKESTGVFAKLFLTGNPGSIIYDQYIQINEDVPITNSFINEIEFKFLTPNGDLYNFNNSEHSYTLEIYELLEQAKYE